MVGRCVLGWKSEQPRFLKADTLSLLPTDPADLDDTPDLPEEVVPRVDTD